MKRVVIPLLALLLAACVLCAGVSATSDITIGKSSSSGSGVISVPEITDGTSVTLEAFIDGGTIRGPVTLSVSTNASFTMKGVTATYPDDVSSLKIGNQGVPIISGNTYPGPYTAPLALSATVDSLPPTTSVAKIDGTYNNTNGGSFGPQDVSVSVSISGRSNINSDLTGHVILSVGGSNVETVKFTVKKYSSPDPDPTPVPPTPTTTPTTSPTATPTTPVGPGPVVTPTQSTPTPTPAKMPPAEKVVEETKTIPASGVVELEETEIVKEIEVPTAIVAENPDASVEVTEGNTEEIDLPTGVSVDEVAKIVEISVVDTAGNKISVDEPGFFTISADVPTGKELVVGHYTTTSSVWENCPVTLISPGVYQVTYTSLSPFSLIYIDEGAANPLLAQPTATPTALVTEQPTTAPATTVATTAVPSATATKSPVPFLGLLAGLAAAGLVLSRK